MSYRVAWANQGCWLFHYEIHYPVTRCQHCSSCHAEHLDSSYYLWKYQTRVSELGRRNTPALIVCLRNFIAGPHTSQALPQNQTLEYANESRLCSRKMTLRPSCNLSSWEWSGVKGAALWQYFLELSLIYPFPLLPPGTAVFHLMFRRLAPIFLELPLAVVCISNHVTSVRLVICDPGQHKRGKHEPNISEFSTYSRSRRPYDSTTHLTGTLVESSTTC